jgi:predicted MFS family arabinose efflux permease
MRGRVNATMRVVNNAFAPLGSLIGGVLAEAIGSRATVAVAAIGLSASGCWLIAARLTSHRELPGWVPADV